MVAARRALLLGLAGALAGTGTAVAASGGSAPAVGRMTFQGANLTAYEPTAPGFLGGLDRAERTLAVDGGNAVEIVLECWMRSPSATTIDCGTTAANGSTGDVTIPDPDLVHEMRTARKLGLFVVLKPHVDIRNCRSGDCFRGDIHPAGWNAWFRSYTAMIVHYARLAQANHVGMLVVGTELTSAQTCSVCRAGWARTIDAVRRVYHGALTYAANVGDYGSFPAWSRMTVLGDDGYFPLVSSAEIASGDGDPTVATLVRRWGSWIPGLQRLSRKYRKPVVFTEIGYQRVEGAAGFPSSPSSTADPAAQASAYEALFRAFRGRAWFHGAFIWDFQGDRVPSAAADTDFDPRRQPAEHVLRHWWR